MTDLRFDDLTETEAAELERLLGGMAPKFRDAREELAYRRNRECWLRRIAASRRLEPLETGVTDPLAPEGWWAA